MLPATVLSANDEVPVLQLEPITVTATRIKDKQENLPLAVGSVGKDDIQLGRHQLGLDESLVNIPPVLPESL